MKFFAPGIPKGQPRPRAFARGKMVRVDDPGTAEAWKAMVAMAAKDHIPDTPLRGPVCVNLTFYFPRPKSHYSKKGGLKENAPGWHTSRPDKDNCEKAVLDALTTVRFWEDDSQICDGCTIKVYKDMFT